MKDRKGLAEDGHGNICIHIYIYTKIYTTYFYTCICVWIQIHLLFRGITLLYYPCDVGCKCNTDSWACLES